MLPSTDGYRLVPEHRTGFSSNPAVWSYGMAMPWQHPAQQLAFPIPLHFVTPQLNAQWFPVENFGSLPPKPKVNKDITSVFGNTKPSRRFSDPGPRICDTDNDGKPFHSHKSKVYVPFEEKWNHSENQRIDEASKDRMLNNLLQELKTARDFNRQLCLELHKANMKLHLTQQHSNEHQPGSMAALVRKLYEAHHIRSDVLSNWSKSGESCGRRSSFASNKFDSDDPEDSLLREREALISRLQTTEKKIQRLRNAQWNNVAPEGPYGPQSTEQRSPMNTRWNWFDKFRFSASTPSNQPTASRRADIPAQQQRLDSEHDIYGRAYTEAGHRNPIGDSGTRPTPTGTPASGFDWHSTSFGRPCHQVGTTSLGSEEKIGNADYDPQYELIQLLSCAAFAD
ncbi:uncharacterized protein LOC130693036 isoform X2 [Daphnia carinata]|uniref:uncharacterized protein LOC130693036 isoform X2 n=1 Tax=Daphnia carinata TaxID=120202 RepID=UPI002580690C|nr:uncharacterized protein LOC130693036 isoform X2 [Daphnia carinata]